MIVVYTAGVFDMLHEGHINILKASRKLGDRLVVGVITDTGVEAYKGRRPIQSLGTRIAVLESLKMVDQVLIQPGTDPSPVVSQLRPAIMTHGDDWDRLIQGQETLESLGVAFVLLPYTKGISSTMLRERMTA